MRSTGSSGPAPLKDFSDLYAKMSGKGESASESHRGRMVVLWLRLRLRLDIAGHDTAGAGGRRAGRCKAEVADADGVDDQQRGHWSELRAVLVAGSAAAAAAVVAPQLRSRNKCKHPISCASGRLEGRNRGRGGG